MTTPTTTTTPMTLSEGQRACAFCGVATTLTPESPELPVDALSIAGQPHLVTRPAAQLRTTFTVCTACTRRHAAVAAVLATLPKVVARLGPAGAEHRLQCASDALAAVGVDAPASTGPEVLALIHHLAVDGALARFCARFAPVMTAKPGSANETPWGHLDDEDRAAMRAAYGAVLAERMARSQPPVALPPPRPGPRACLMCGVGSVTVPADVVVRLGGAREAANALWSPVETARTSLGGRGGLERVSGNLCRPCFSAAESEGAIGISALERALISHLRATGREREASMLRQGTILGLKGWAIIGSPPNLVPWEHVGLSSVSAAG